MEHLNEWIRYIVIVFMGLLPIANPFSTAPVFAGLTAGMGREKQLKIAKLAAMYMCAVLLVFLFAGVVILDFFGVTVEGLRIAGGIIILVIGLRMLFLLRNLLRQNVHQEEDANAHDRRDNQHDPGEYVGHLVERLAFEQ